MTVVLCCSWNGDKVPVLVIRKSASEKEPVLKKYTTKCGEDVYFCGQKKAWNDTTIMVKWINCMFMVYIHSNNHLLNALYLHSRR